MKKSFDLILSFDDVITHGHRESVTMAQLEAYLEMDSTDEKMFKKMQLIREAEAKEIAKKQQREIAKRKLDPAYKDSLVGGAVKSISSQDYQSSLGLGPAQIGGGSSGGTGGSLATITPSKPTPGANWMEETQAQTRKAPGKGMQLGKPKKQNELMKDLQKEKLFTKPQEAFVEETKAEPVMTVNPLLENVIIEVEEKLNCSLNRDGEISKFEIKGIIYITVNDPKKNNPAAQLSFQSVKGFTFKPHPELDKQKWNKSKVICSADQESGFPAQTRLDAVRYNYRSKDEADLPFTLNVFNSKKGAKNVITLELEANQNCNLSFKRIERVTVALNLGSQPVDIEVQKSQGASVEQDESNNQLLWHV